MAHELGDGDQVDAGGERLGAEGVAEHMGPEGVERVIVTLT